MSSERAVRKRNIPSEASSSGIIRSIGSERGFLRSFEKVVRKRNMPSGDPKAYNNWKIRKTNGFPIILRQNIGYNWKT